MEREEKQFEGLEEGYARQKTWGKDITSFQEHIY